MAGKFNKFLAFTAAAGAIAAGVYYYLQNKNANQYDDFDDFSDDLEEDASESDTHRSYVDLNLEKSSEIHADAETAAEEAGSDTEEVAASQETAVEDVFLEDEEEISDPQAASESQTETAGFQTEISEAEALKTTIEEFFDDEDDLDSV